MFKNSTRILPFLLVLSLCATGASAGDSVVGADGAVMTLRNATYGELFPAGAEADGGSSVLALDVLRHGAVERLLVPGSETFQAESSESIYYDESFDRTFVLYAGLFNGFHQLVYVLSYDGAQWSAPIEIAGNSYANKSNLQLVIRNDNTSTQKRFGDRGGQRVCAFVAWTEALGDTVRHRMVPLLLIDDQVLSLEHRLTLSEFLPPKTDMTFHGEEISKLLRLQGGFAATGAVTGFVDASANRLATLGIELVPAELSRLAEQVEAIVGGLNLNGADPEAVEAQVRARILAAGADFSQGSLRDMADDVAAMIREAMLDGKPGELPALDLPAKARARIVFIGARRKANGLADNAVVDLIEVAESPLGGAPYHHFKISRLSSRSIPTVDGLATLFLSGDGLDALVAWSDGEAVYYRETSFGFWSQVQSIQLTEELTRDDVYNLLEERTFNK